MSTLQRSHAQVADLNPEGLSERAASICAMCLMVAKHAVSMHEREARATADTGQNTAKADISRALTPSSLNKADGGRAAAYLVADEKGAREMEERLEEAEQKEEGEQEEQKEKGEEVVAEDKAKLKEQRRPSSADSNSEHNGSSAAKSNASPPKQKSSPSAVMQAELDELREFVGAQAPPKLELNAVSMQDCLKQLKAAVSTRSPPASASTCREPRRSHSIPPIFVFDTLALCCYFDYVTRCMCRRVPPEDGPLPLDELEDKIDSPLVTPKPANSSAANDMPNAKLQAKPKEKEKKTKQEEQEETPAASFVVGDTVKIHGLTGAAQHNGKTGVVQSFDATKGRYAVALTNGKKKPLAIKPINLARHPPLPKGFHFQKKQSPPVASPPMAPQPDVEVQQLLAKGSAIEAKVQQSDAGLQSLEKEDVREFASWMNRSATVVEAKMAAVVTKLDVLKHDSRDPLDLDF